MPEISIILPFFNAEKYINNALNSIANQTFQDFECLMINNNSTDKSVDIAKSFEKNDKRFRLLNESCQGVAFASDKGSKNANSGLIARMDADDIALPKRLELQYAFLKMNPSIDAVFGKVKFGGNKKYAEGLYRYVKWNNSLLNSEDIFLRRFIESPVINPTAMWRKKSEKQAGGFMSGDFPEDYEMWLRWLDNGMKLEKINEYILQWNDFRGRLTRNDPRYSSDAFYEIKSKYLAKELERINPHHPEIMVWGASRIMRRRAEKLEKYGIEIKAWIDISDKRILNEKIIYYQNLPEAGEIFLLVYVPQPDFKKKIEDYLISKNYSEGKDFLFAG